jgi:hypothetical protein
MYPGTTGVNLNGGPRSSGSLTSDLGQGTVGEPRHPAPVHAGHRRAGAPVKKCVGRRNVHLGEVLAPG